MIKHIYIEFGVQIIDCKVSIIDPERESGVIKIPKTIEVQSVQYKGFDITNLLEGINFSIGNNLVWNKIDELIAEKL